MSKPFAHDVFAPLSDKEKANAGRRAQESESDAGELVAPIPSDAPEPPESHPRFGKPSLRWTYPDARGSALFHVLRFDPPGERKQFMPLTLWRAADGLRWRWRSVRAPRPLYGLDRLADRPDAPVVICEGEKAADAAAPIFPRSVCVTSPGGSNAATQADWSPVAGRRVLVWPDADAPGVAYAQKVATTLAGLGCDVSIIDAMALARLTPDRQSRVARDGWDAADAGAAWLDLQALYKHAIALAQPYVAGPSFISWGAFEMDAEGLTQTRAGKGKDREPEEVNVSAAFEIIGRARDPHGYGWGRFLRWRDHDGRQHERFVADAALHGDPATLCAGLAEGGLSIARSEQRAFACYLSGAETRQRVTMVQRTGWHDIGGKLAFVLPGAAIGAKGADTVVLDAAAHGPYETRGTLADWQGGVAALAAGHALPVLAISAALAGPLLYLAGLEGGGVNFFGASSKGKTTLLQLAASVWGRGSSPGYVRAWRATANGLEGAAASATDTALILDELGMVEARDAAAGLYSLANGQGKARAARDGGLREPKSWRALVLSSGELPTEAKLSEDRGRKPRAGQLVRMLDVPADRGFGYGAFDNAGPDRDAGKLANALKHAAIAAYGSAGPAFVRRLIAEDETGENVRAQIEAFTEARVPRGADGQIDRASQRFALIAAAGELAIAFELVPWRQGEPTAAAAWALAQWIEGRGGTEPAEFRQAIEQVRLFMEQHGETRFEASDDVGMRPVNNRAGWRKGNGSDREWLVPPEVWKAEICNGLDAKMVARVLAERGMLARSSDGFQQVRKIGGQARRVFVVTAGIYDGGGNDA
jgi:putative DNA primase/helicase